MKNLLFILTFLLPLFAAAQKDSINLKKDEIETWDEPPTYPGGDSALNEFIRINLVYPRSALKDSLEGKVFIRFFIETDGSVKEAKAVKTFNEACSKEAVRVIKLTKWNPGKRNGKPVRIEFIMPVIFKLK